jgi:hypothetical protein
MFFCLNKYLNSSRSKMVSLVHFCIISRGLIKYYQTDRACIVQASTGHCVLSPEVSGRVIIFCSLVKIISMPASAPPHSPVLYLIAIEINQFIRPKSLRLKSKYIPRCLIDLNLFPIVLLIHMFLTIGKTSSTMPLSGRNEVRSHGPGHARAVSTPLFMVL